ncbi:MAG: T9SS type A sorting domain-containing protein, partial [Bacteroidales bacterium]
GTDTAWVKVQNPDGDDDTLRVIFKAISPVFCKGDTIILKPFFQITPSQITISSTPSDSTLIPKSFGVFSDVLNQTTRYFVKGIMPLGNIVSDSIDITIVAMQQPILSIIGNNPFCPADSIQILASPNNYKTNWYCNDLLIPENDSLANYRTSKSGDYYAIQYDQNGCKNNSAILTIEKYLKLEYNINADTTVCINIDSLQLFSQFTNSKSVSWTASGDGMLTILPNQNLIYHPGTSDRTNGSTFLSVIAEGVGSCSIVTDTIKIFFTPIPSKPSIPLGLDSLCINSPNSVFTCNGGTNAIYSEWAITPENAGAINNSSISYALIDWNNSFSGKAFLSVRAVNQCGMSNSSDTLAVKIIPIPGKADLPIGPSQICQNSPDQTFTTFGTPNASHYQWSILPANAANFSGNDNSIITHWNNGFTGTATITVKGINNCGIGAISDTFNLSVNPLPTKPGIPLGQTQLCVNSNNSFYTTLGSNYASIYQWNIYPEIAGVIIDSSTTSLVDWNNNFSGIAKLTVKGINECGSKISDSLTIKIDSLPEKPSIPSGLGILCNNSTNTTYSTIANPFINIYNWSIYPTNAGIINNFGATTLVNWNNNFSGPAFISVSAVNQCGTSNSSDTLSVNIIPIPGKADIPTGLSQICQNSNDQIFTTLETPSASHYQWNIIPANAANLTGNSNNTVAHFNSGFIGAAAITVQGVNNCGIGAVSDTFNLNIKPLPTKPSIPLGQTQLCINSNNSFYTTSGSNYASAYQWNIFPETAGVIIDSASTSFINWDSSFFGISKLIVKGTNECGSKSSDTLTIKIDPLPSKPSIPSGLEVLCNNTANVSYSTIAIPYTNSYNWNIYPTNAGSINNFGTNAIVNWNNYFTGLANISVKAINNCGISEASDSLAITVNSRPSNPIITNGPVSVKTDTTLFSSYTAYSIFSDSIIWWVEPSEAATLIPFNSNCDVYWNSNYSGNAQLKLKAKNDCGYSDSTVVFNVIILTAIGIENHLEMNLTVFPNPSSSGKFIIRFNQRQILKNTLIKITDQLGRIVFEKDIHPTELIGKSIEANISAFSKGIYFLSIGEKTRKIIFE